MIASPRCYPALENYLQETSFHHRNQQFFGIFLSGKKHFCSQYACSVRALPSRSLLCKWLLFFMALLFISCSGSAPVIEDIKWRVLYRDNGSHRYEELSVFLRIRDPDGLEDLTLMSITAGKSGFVWRFPKDEWIRKSISGVDWQGLPGIIPLNNFRLPDTLYTLRLEDLAGRSDERTFRPDPDRPRAGGIQWPQVSMEKQVVHIDGTIKQGVVIFRNERLEAIDIQNVSDGNRVNQGAATWWELWIPLSDTSGGFLLGPYPFSSTVPAE